MNNEETLYMENCMESIQEQTKVLNIHENRKFNSELECSFRNLRR